MLFSLLHSKYDNMRNTVNELSLLLHSIGTPSRLSRYITLSMFPKQNVNGIIPQPYVFLLNKIYLVYCVSGMFECESKIVIFLPKSRYLRASSCADRTRALTSICGLLFVHLPCIFSACLTVEYERRNLTFTYMNVLRCFLMC